VVEYVGKLGENKR